jgi:hypothetical protein
VYTVRTMRAYTGGGPDLVWYGAAGDRTKTSINAFVMALAGSAQRCLSKLLSSGRGEAARVGGAGQALGPLTRRGCWSSVDHVPPDITR